METAQYVISRLCSSLPLTAIRLDAITTSPLAVRHGTWSFALSSSGNSSRGKTVVAQPVSQLNFRHCLWKRLPGRDIY